MSSTEILKGLNDKDNYLPLRGYSTSIKSEGVITGKTLLLNKIKNACVIDFNIRNNLEENKDKIFKMIPKENTIIIEAPRKGFYVFCRNDLDGLVDKNSFIDVFTSDDFKIHIFIGNNPSKHQFLHCPPTKVRLSVDGELVQKMFQYKFVNNDFSFDGELITLSEMLEILMENDIAISTSEFKPVVRERFLQQGIVRQSALINRPFNINSYDWRLRIAYEESKSAYEQSRIAYEESRIAYEQSRCAYEQSRNTYEQSRNAYERLKIAYEQSKNMNNQ